MLRIGDLIFVKGDSLTSELIEFAENGIYSHVCIYAGETNGQQMVLEANGFRRIGYRSLSDYSGYYDIGHIRASEIRRKLVLEYAKSQIGKRYGWKLIGLLILKLLFHIDRPYKAAYGIVCSNYAVDAWKYAGVVITKIDKPTPQDVADSVVVEIEKLS